MRILRVEQLLDRQRQLFFKRLLIRLLCRVLTGFGCLQQGVVSSADVSLDITPSPVDSPSNGALFLHVVDTFLMQNLFDISAKLRTFQRLGGEVAAEIFILQVLAYILKTFLPVDERLNDGPQGLLNFFVGQFAVFCFNSHRILPIAVTWGGIKKQGPGDASAILLLAQ